MSKAYHILNCKESLLARTFQQASFKEGTGVLDVDLDDGTTIRNVPSKARVKFFDTKNDLIVFGPLQVALANKFPIARDSLRKLRDGVLRRLLAD